MDKRLFDKTKGEEGFRFHIGSKRKKCQTDIDFGDDNIDYPIKNYQWWEDGDPDCGS